MTIKAAKENLTRWRRWAAGVRSRWEPDSPMARLAQRRVLEAELRVLALTAQAQISLDNYDKIVYNEATIKS